MFYKRKIFRLRFPFLMGAYYLWVKIVGAVVWEHGNICLGKKSHSRSYFRPKKIKYLVQIFYFVSQFMINAHHHLFVADIVVALIQFLGFLRQNRKERIPVNWDFSSFKTWLRPYIFSNFHWLRLLN